MIWRPLRRSTAATLCSSATLDANDAFALAEWYRPTVINNVRLKSIITVMFISTDSHGSVCISRASCLTSVRDMALKMYSVSNREWPDGNGWKGSRRDSRISQLNRQKRHQFRQQLALTVQKWVVFFEELKKILFRDGQMGSQILASNIYNVGWVSV